jgi:DNA repair protein SbcC/Rad50
VQIEVDRIETERGAILKAQEWYDTKTRLDTRVAEGDAALTQALETDQAAEAERATLTVVLKAFSLRAELEAAAATGRKLAEAEKALVDAVKAERKAGEEREQAVTASDVAKAKRDEQRAAYDTIGPELDKAKEIDAKIDAAKTDLAERKSLLERRISEKDASGKAVAQVEAALKSVHDQQVNDDRWLAKHQSVEVLSVRIEDIAKDLSERLALEREIASTTAKVEQLERDVKAAGTSRLQKETEIALLRDRERDLNERISAFRNIADAIDIAAVEARRDMITAIQAALDNVRDATEDAGKAHAGIATATEEAARQDMMICQASAVTAQVDAELPTDTARLEEARRSLDLSKAAGSKPAEHLRLILEDGQPCPVCGATEHPVTDVDRLLKDRVSADRRRVAELQEQVSASQADRTRAETQIIAAKDTLQGISRRRAGHEAGLQAAGEKWRVSVAAVLNSCGEIGVAAPTFAEDAAAAEAAATIAPFREMMNRFLSEAQETLKRTADAEAEARKLDAERERVRTDLATAGEGIVKFTAQEHAKANELGILNATLRGMEQNRAAVCSRLDTALAPVFPDWREKVTTSGAAFVEVCRDLVAQWRECRARLEISSAEISRLEAELEGKQATLKAVEAAVVEAEKQYSDEQGELDELASERLKVIGGRPVGEVRTEYRERSEAAEKAWNDAEITRSKAEQVAAARSSDTGGARMACDAARTDHEGAERVLAEKLVACEINQEQAESAIAKGETWIVAEQSRLDDLRKAVDIARATLTERQQSVKEHDSVGRPEQTREEITAALAAMEVPRAKAAEDLIETNSVLRHDDQARSRMAEIKAALDDRREKVLPFPLTH